MLLVLLVPVGALLGPGPRPRRDVIAGAAAAAATALAPGPLRSLAATVPLSASWTATAGFSDASFISFDDAAYKAMVDDERRTPLFERAIKQRLAAAGQGMVVCDVRRSTT